VARLRSSFIAKLIAFDTAPLIDYVQEHSLYFDLTEELFRDYPGTSSTGCDFRLTLTEPGFEHPMLSR